MKLGNAVHYSLFSLLWCWIVEQTSVRARWGAIVSTASSSFPGHKKIHLFLYWKACLRSDGPLSKLIWSFDCWGCSHSSHENINTYKYSNDEIFSYTKRPKSDKMFDISIGMSEIQGNFECYEKSVKSHLTATLAKRVLTELHILKSNNIRLYRKWVDRGQHCTCFESWDISISECK